MSGRDSEVTAAGVGPRGSAGERLDLPLHLDQVHAALDGVGHPPRRPPPPPRPCFGWDALTDAEHVVAEQVAQGRTNRAVAEALYVSVHTVNTHLRSIFAKLDLHSRVQLANAWNARPPNRRHVSPVPTPEASNFQYSSSNTSRRLRPGRPISTRSF